MVVKKVRNGFVDTDLGYHVDQVDQADQAETRA